MKNDRLAIVGCALFALVGLGFAVHETRQLTYLLRDGQRADAEVVEIYVGVKGGKKAVFEFATSTGETVRARDLFQMYVIRHRLGDGVTALYDPEEPARATIDIGTWMWQEPGIAYFAFIVFAVLGILIVRSHRPKPLPEK